MEGLQLLVEIVAQALQVVGGAQFIGVDDLVETGGVGLVVGPPLFRGLRLRRPALRCFFGLSRIAFVLEFRRWRLESVDCAFLGAVRGVVGRFALHRILRLLVFALAFGLVGLLRRRLVFCLLIRFLGVGIGIAREAQGREDFSHQPRVGALVE